MRNCEIRVGDIGNNLYFGNIIREEGAVFIVAMARQGFNAVTNTNDRLYLRELRQDRVFEVRIVAFNAFDAPNENFEISFRVVN